MTRSSAFFNGDVARASEALAYPLGDDYGLSEDDTAALGEAVEKVVHDFFAARADAGTASARNTIGWTP